MNRNVNAITPRSLREYKVTTTDDYVEVAVKLHGECVLGFALTQTDAMDLASRLKDAVESLEAAYYEKRAEQEVAP